jgi:hypothetical protein
LFASSFVPWYFYFPSVLLARERMILANAAAATSTNLIAGVIQKLNDYSFPNLRKFGYGSETLTIYPRRRGTGKLSNSEMRGKPPSN